MSSSPLSLPPIPDLLAALEAGDGDALVAGARAHLALRPADPLAGSLLAAGLGLQGDVEGAARVHEQLTRLQPAEAAHWNNLGTALRELRRLAPAHEAYLQATRLDPSDPMPHHNLGLLALDRVDYAAAREHLLDAHERDPAHPVVRLHAAMACHECGDFERERRLIADWRQWPQLADEDTQELAWLLAQNGQAEQACGLLQALASRSPRPERAWLRLVLVLERINRLDEARQILQRLPPVDALTDPGLREDRLNAEAVLAMRASDWTRAHALFSQLLAQPVDPQKLSNLYFAFARVCDRLGRYDEAMQACAQAHAGQVASVAALVPELLAPGAPALPAALARWSASDHAAARPVQSPPAAQSPVFVVGFPRSGTTLLEQMLDAHPDLCAMDEQPFLQQVGESLERRGLDLPQALGELDQAECDALRADYWRRVHEVVRPGPGQRLVDKNPLNLLRLPLILRLFPNARVILALRHPCDVLLSCYTQAFRSPAFAVMCSSLDKLAHGYADAMAGALAHVALCPARVLELRYEDLVQDTAAQVQRVGRFLELPQPERLLEFQGHARAKGYISTPSYTQVVEGINRKGLDRWHGYRAQFAPILPVLQPWLQRWGYL